MSERRVWGVAVWAASAGMLAAIAAGIWTILSGAYGRYAASMGCWAAFAGLHAWARYKRDVYRHDTWEER